MYTKKREIQWNTATARRCFSPGRAYVLVRQQLYDNNDCCHVPRICSICTRVCCQPSSVVSPFRLSVDGTMREKINVRVVHAATLHFGNAAVAANAPDDDPIGTVRGTPRPSPARRHSHPATARARHRAMSKTWLWRRRRSTTTAYCVVSARAHSHALRLTLTSDHRVILLCDAHTLVHKLTH